MVVHRWCFEVRLLMKIMRTLYPFGRYKLSGSIGRTGFAEGLVMLVATTFVGFFVPMIVWGVIGAIVHVGTHGSLIGWGQGGFGRSILGMALTIPVLILWTTAGLLFVYGLVCLGSQRLRSVGLNPHLLWLGIAPVISLITFGVDALFVYSFSLPIALLLLLVAMPSSGSSE